MEPPAKKTSEASSDKGTVAETKPQSGELSDFAKGVSKFVSGVVSMFGSKDGNPEPIISSSSDTMIGRMLVNKHNTPSPQVQQDLPPVPKTAAKGRL
jgi:hypothetical protein